MVGWKTKILMELSTPLTVVVTSAWDSLMSMVAIGSPVYFVRGYIQLVQECLCRERDQGEDTVKLVVEAPRWGPG